MDTTMKLEKFEDFGKESIKIRSDLSDILKNNAIPGISAPELGIMKSVFMIKNVLNAPWIIAFNPRIVYSSDQLVDVHETCYSYPGIMVRIRRPQSIRVRYQTVTGETTTQQLEGAVARLFQHEMVHMNDPARPFWIDASYLHKNKAIKDWKSMSRKLRRD
jgi:peptide deformylase